MLDNPSLNFGVDESRAMFFLDIGALPTASAVPCDFYTEPPTESFAREHGITRRLRQIKFEVERSHWFLIGCFPRQTFFPFT